MICNGTNCLLRWFLTIAWPMLTVHNLLHHLVHILGTRCTMYLPWPLALSAQFFPLPQCWKEMSNVITLFYWCCLLLIGAGNAYLRRKRVETCNLHVAENMQADTLLKCLVSHKDKTAKVCQFLKVIFYNVMWKSGIQLRWMNAPACLVVTV